jgi:monoamine oxidase
MTKVKGRGTASADSVSRRDILLGATAVGTALALSGSGPALAGQKSSTKEILVLGAGMAGLTAALALLRLGYQVTIIEYQDRIGGRLWSLPLGEGMYTEAGGGHFRSNMPYVLSYIRRFNLPMLSLNDGLPRYILDGEIGDGADLSRWPWPLAAEERNVTVSANLNRYLYRVGLDSDSVLDPRWPGPEDLERLQAISLGDLITNVGASDSFCELLNAHGGTFTSDSQALGAIPDLAYHFGDQNLFRIRGGNNRLPMSIAKELGLDRIKLGKQVVAIDQTGPKVRVATKDGDEFTGDAVVCTIPFSVLDEVEAKPGWSAPKVRMFKEMEWDKTVKIITKTRTPSWLAEGVHGWPMAGGDRPWERVIDITGNEPAGRGNLFFYLNGTNAEALLARPKATRAQDIVDQFRDDLPGLVENVVEVKEFAWTEQPWIRGSFGGPPIGGGWMLGEWAKPEGRIFFAGDFTTLKSGWVEGAIESGLRAARQIDPAAKPEGNVFIRQEL